MGEPVFCGKVTDVPRQHMYSLTWELPNIGEQFIPVDPEMLLRLYSSADGIEGGSQCLYALLYYGTIVCEGLESLSIITLEHELQLLAAFVAVISSISLNVQDIQVIKDPDIEGSPVLRLVGGIEVKCWGIPAVTSVREGHYTKGKC